MKGFIYKITSSQSDKIYIGSTKSSLKKRLRSHHTEKKYVSAQLIICYDDHKIELIEEVEVENLNELRKKEGEHIKLNWECCINEKIPGRTQGEWYDDNFETISKKKKEYMELNKDYFSVLAKQYREDHKEQLKSANKKWVVNNREYNLAKQKEYYTLNRKKDKEQRCSKIICECGKEMNKSSLNRHKKTNCNIILKT